MQRGRVLNFKVYNKIFEIIFKNKLLILFTVIFILGICVSVFTFGKNELIEIWTKAYIEKFFLKRIGVGLLKITIDSFLTSLLFIVLNFVCGTSMLGIILVPISVLIKAFMYGSITTYLYSAFSLEGVAFHAIILLPSSIFFIIAFLFSAIDSLRFSFSLANLTFSKNADIILFFEFKQYCIKYLYLSVFVLVSSFLDAILSLNFLDNFKLF